MMRLRRSSCKLNLFAILGDTANYENKRKKVKEAYSFIIRQ